MGKHSREKKETRRRLKWIFVFPAWSPPPDDEITDERSESQANAFARLRQAFLLPVESGGQKAGTSQADLDCALELAKMFRELGEIHVLPKQSEQDPEQGIFRLIEKGGTYEVSNNAKEMLTKNWKALRDKLGIGAAEDIDDVEDFLKDGENERIGDSADFVGEYGLFGIDPDPTAEEESEGED